MAIILTKKGQEILVDDCDFEELSRDRWYVDGKGYARRNSTKAEHGNGRRKGVLMHRKIMGFPVGFEIDHQNHNKLDNRKSNLRIVTTSQNQMNRPVQSNNRLGIKGIHYCNTRKKFVAQIKINKKKINLGRFTTIEAAVEARKQAEIKYHGDFAYKS